MTLPASGQISFNDLRVELGIPTQAPFSITTAATNGYVTINTSSPSYPNSSAPHAISEWYSYNHNASVCNNLGSFATTATDPQSDPSNCGGGGNEYTNGTYTLYSTNCSDLTSPTGCTIYQNSGCTTTAYAFGIRGFTDSSLYYLLDASSNITTDGICLQ